MSGVWVDCREFARVFGRTGQWARFNARQGNLGEFGIVTMRVLGVFTGPCKWYFLIPLELIANDTLASPKLNP